MNDIDLKIEKWKKLLRKNPALEDGYIDELESHLRDLIDEHVDQGISLEGSFNYAVEQLGDTYELGNQFYKTYTTKYSGRPSWQSPVWMPSLLWNYIKIAIRNIKRYKSYSLINIFGFAVALIPAVLTFLYVAYEFSYDKYNENYDRIYRVVSQHGAKMPMPLAEALESDVPEIECAIRMNIFKGFISYNNKKELEQNILYADVGMFRIFTFDFITGNPETALNDKYSIVLSESMAGKYFGDNDPVGQTVILKELYQLKVTGVYKDLPESSHFKADFVVPASIIDPSKSRMALLAGGYFPWGFNMFFTYVMLKENASPASFTGKIHDIIEKNSGKSMYETYNYSAQALSDIHLYSHFDTELNKNADLTQINVFLTMALIVLVIAVINYVNLATARSTRRIKEIGVRKVIGAKKTQLIRQLIAETIIITVLSFTITLVLVNFTLPYFNEFINRNIQFNLFDSIELVIGIIGLLIFVSLAAGIYPALILSSMKPLSFFGGSYASSRKPKFRSALVILQFIVTIVLVFVTFIINRQLSYIANKDLGYGTDNIVCINFKDRHSYSSRENFVNELKQYPGIVNASLSSNYPGGRSYESELNWPGKPKDSSTRVGFISVDYNFIDLYDIKMLDGRKFSSAHPSDESEGLILSETAVKEMGLENPVGKPIRHRTYRGTANRYVTGISKDFHTGSLHIPITPYFIVIDSSMANNYLSVKIDPRNREEAIAVLREKISAFEPDYNFAYTFLDDMIKSMYRTEYKLQTAFSIFSGFTILISCLGLFGLISFTTESRQKEIGIRKVLGASPIQVALKLLKEILVLIFLASILSAPLSYYGSEKWLEDFAYRIDLTIFPFIISLTFIVVVAFATTGYQIFKAVLVNPIETIRNE